jgi:hypothetical protein
MVNTGPKKSNASEIAGEEICSSAFPIQRAPKVSFCPPPTRVGLSGLTVTPAPNDGLIVCQGVNRFCRRLAENRWGISSRITSNKSTKPIYLNMKDAGTVKCIV